MAAVRRVRPQFQARGSLAPQTHRCGRKSRLTPARKLRLEQLLARPPDATLAELGRQRDRSAGTSTVDLWLRGLGWQTTVTIPALRYWLLVTAGGLSHPGGNTTVKIAVPQGERT